MLLTAWSRIHAQQFFFKNYSPESGLPFVLVSSLYQDRNGYLWGGGLGGLTRFDGKQFVNYSRKSGLIDRNVNTICSNDSGHIFIGTNKGLSILRGSKFKNFGRFGDLATPYVTSLCRDSRHSIYVGTRRGLFLYSQGALKPVKRLESYSINCLYKPDTALIFIGTTKGVVILGKNTYKVINKAGGLASDGVNSLTMFRNFLAVGTDEGLSLYDLATGKITNYYIENGLIDNEISSLCSQRNKYLWVGSQTGLLRFDGSEFDYYNVEAYNNSNQVVSILVDREDNLWLGTHNGLFRYRDNSFTTYDKVNGLGNSFIFQVFRDNTGDLWACSDNNGIYRGTQNYFKRYDRSAGLTSITSRSGLQDAEGRLLFGLSNGVSQFKNERFTSVPVTPELKGEHNAMYKAKDNKTVWIGGSNGIASLVWKKGVPESRFYPIRARTDFNVYGFCQDDAGSLYVSTHKAGLFKMEGDSLVSLSKRLQLNEESFFMLRYLYGKMFLATLNGVLVLDMKTNGIRRITEEDGLNSDLVYSIELTEGNRSLWVGTNQGINKVNLEKYLLTGELDITSYGKQEGFAGAECNGNGIWEDRDGTLWFGTVSGLVKYQPYSFKRNLVETKTLIQHIQIMNEDTALLQFSRLPSKFNTVAFYYRGICLTNPDKVKYQKKLEGLDKDWSLPDPEDYIKYSNLAPGKYTFRVRSCNNEGVWNTNDTAFTFTINTPFYLAWWFILFLLVLIVSVIYAIFKVRIYYIKKKQKDEFERRVEMSRIELKALRSQMNPHFVFNSLNSIQHYIFNAKSDEAIKYLNKFARLVRIILNNSEKPTVTVGDDIEALRLYLELEQMRFEEKFDYEIVIDDSVDPDYDIMPPLLMQPYVENAILHGLNPKPVKGKLSIHLSARNNFLICTITDNGIGREKAAEIRRTMPLKNHKSLGMKITEDRLRILNEINNSQLSVTVTDLKDMNNMALGTRVEIFVPLTG